MIKMINYVDLEREESGLLSSRVLQVIKKKKMNCRISPTNKETRSGKRNGKGLLLFKVEKETSHENVLPLKAGRGTEAEKNNPPYASMKGPPERQGSLPKYGRHQDA